MHVRILASECLRANERGQMFRSAPRPHTAGGEKGGDDVVSGRSPLVPE